MSAEDCNLEILRLSHAFPHSTTTTTSFQQLDSKSEIVTPDQETEFLQQQGALPTPTNLLLSSPLRFVAIRQNVPLEMSPDMVDENMEPETIVDSENDPFQAKLDSSYDNNNSSTKMNAENNFAKKDYRNISR